MAQVEVFSTIPQLIALGWSKKEILALLSGAAGAKVAQVEVVQSINFYQQTFQLEKKDLICLLQGNMGTSLIQQFLQVKFLELRNSGYSTDNICRLLGRGIGRSTRENNFKMVTVLCNVATQLGNDYPSLTKNYIAHLINSICEIGGKKKFTDYCTRIGRNNLVITKSSQGILKYLTSYATERSKLIDQGCKEEEEEEEEEGSSTVASAPKRPAGNNNKNGGGGLSFNSRGRNTGNLFI